MKKIAYLILLLTCHQLWAIRPTVSISEKFYPVNYIGLDSVAEQFFYLIVNDEANLLPDPQFGTRRKTYSMPVYLKFTYTFVNDTGEQRTVEVMWTHPTTVEKGKITSTRYVWKRPGKRQINALARDGFLLSTNVPAEITLLRSYSLTVPYIIDDNSMHFRDGPIRGYGVLHDDDGNNWDNDVGHFQRAWELWYSFLRGFGNLDANGDWRWDDKGELRRHLDALYAKHKITKYSVRQTVDNDSLLKSLVSFDTSMFKKGVSMEHVFRLVYEYTYTHRVTGGKAKKITMTKMVNALIPTGENKVQGTVYAPLPPWDFRLLMFITFRNLDKIKVELESPHMLPVNQSSAYYYDGPYNNYTDGNKFDDHLSHTWDQKCTTGHHDSLPFKGIPLGLALDPEESLVRRRDN